MHQKDQEQEDDFFGPVKVMDGLFLGDHFTAKVSFNN